MIGVAIADKQSLGGSQVLGTRSTWVASMLVVCLAAGTVSAAELLSTTVDISVFGQTVPLPLRVVAEDACGKTNDLLFTVTAEATEALKAISTGVSERINEQGNCRERFSASNPKTWIANGSINHSVKVRAEKWACENVFGREVTTRLARDSGTIRLAIRPVTSGGNLVFELSAFRIDGLSDVARLLGIDRAVKQRLQKDLDAINRDPTLTRPPPELANLGFSYASVRCVADQQRQLVELTIAGKLNAAALAGLLEYLR